MHSFLTQEDDWRTEVLGEDRREGCTLFEYLKRNLNYDARIKLWEHFRNESFSVEATVHKCNGHTSRTLDTAVFFRGKDITGNGLECKAEAAKYLVELRTEIDLTYFSNPS